MIGHSKSNFALAVICFHCSYSLSIVHAAFAGLVDGSFTGVMPQTGARCFMNHSYAAVPLQ